MEEKPVNTPQPDTAIEEEVSVLLPLISSRKLLLLRESVVSAARRRRSQLVHFPHAF